MAKCYLWKCNRPASEMWPVCAIHISRVDPATREELKDARRERGSDRHLQAGIKLIAEAYLSEVLRGS